MKILTILNLFVLLLPILSFASESIEQRMDYLFGEHKIYKDYFFQLKGAVIKGDKEKVSELVGYPITIYGDDEKFVIKNKIEFLKLYESVISENILIALKQQRFKDLFARWSGVMIGNGEIWYHGICQDDECKKVTLEVKSFNNPHFFKSEKGQKAVKDLLKNERSRLHKSLLAFREPILLWNTKKYIIRIDRTSDNKYRYSAWDITSDQSKKPNIILKNGKRVSSGSGGNHYYEFKNGEYKYVCYVTVLGTEETPPGSIEVFKNDKRILYQPVTRVLNL